jgi:putative acetyltransferase
MKANIRAYQQGDEDAVLHILQEVLSSYGLRTSPYTTDKDLADVSDSYIRRGGVFRIVEADGRIVGSYGLYPLSERTCELRKMYLLTSYQGQGIGKMMMEDALVRARERGFEEIVLETNSVLTRARRLYERFGFESYVPEHLSDRCDCAMKLKL